MTSKFALARTAALGLFTAILVGCSGDHAHNTPSQKDGPGKDGPGHEVTVEEIRDKLSAEDRALVEAQEWCVVSTEERLGSMGAPIKLDINGQPVFICCKGCKKSAERDPEKTLATLAELKAKKAGK
jgi:hypothetical protein